ncbi:MAG: hypothetical protein LBD50_01620 [Rickettsiales bacterium]|jgi:hypothetical protein|nr:hypothetical protein [Rickettsiales bacterium]
MTWVIAGITGLLLGIIGVKIEDWIQDKKDKKQETEDEIKRLKDLVFALQIKRKCDYLRNKARIINKKLKKDEEAEHTKCNKILSESEALYLDDDYIDYTTTDEIYKDVYDPEWRLRDIKLESNTESKSVRIIIPAKLIEELFEINKEYRLSPSKSADLLQEIFHGNKSKKSFEQISEEYGVPLNVIAYIVKNAEYRPD